MSRSALGAAASLALGVALVAPQLALAHAFAPSLLELRQQAPSDDGVHAYEVRFKQPKIRRSGSELRPVFPQGCAATDVATVEEEGTGLVARWPLACDGTIVGRPIAVEGIADSQADVLLRLELSGGRSVRHVLSAESPSFRVPQEESAWDVFRTYCELGVEHILLGFDHLLFVLGLVLLVTGGRRLLYTVTAFTLGHSVTLALAALGVVHLPQGPVEALIAFSIYVLAVELARRHAAAGSSVDSSARKIDGESWLQRKPWTMAAGFGLLHGLGFAGALTEVGLPESDVPAALFAFNVGIELGQLAFVAVVLLAMEALGLAFRRLTRPLPRWASLAPAYFIGCLAAYWTLERLFG